LIFAWLFGIPANELRVWSIGAVMLLMQVSISALNDWADRDRDLGRNRPIAVGLLDPQYALAFALVSGLASVGLAALTGEGILAVGLVVVMTFAGWAYDLVLKPTPFSFLPFAIAFPLLPVWVGVLADRSLRSLLVFLFAGLPLSIAVHLADSIPDRDLDRKLGLRTAAVFLGWPLAEIATGILLVAGGSIAALAGRNRVVTWWLLPLAVLGVALNYVNMHVGRRTSTPRVLMLGKWTVVAMVLLSAAFVVGAAR
jgi:4-hydroxybenzoate polyprenyltransferase